MSTTDTDMDHAAAVAGAGVGPAFRPLPRCDRCGKVYFMKLLCNCLLMLIFWAPIKLSTTTLMARSKSLLETYGLSLIFAKDSAILKIDSKCLTVIGKEPVVLDSFLRSE